MADYQQLIEDIRAFVASADQTHTEELTAWASEYAKACKEINSRLRQCREYLQKGFRSEAIHLADKHPPVLDVVSTLDFPELPQWQEVCLQYEMAVPPRLAADAAQALNDAYNEEMPLKSLLNIHRTLNLAQAPLSVRISVLQQLAEADGTSPHWDDDIQSLQKSRIVEITVAANAAARARDRERLIVLRDELNASGWRIPIPAQTNNTINSQVASLQLADAESLILGLLPQLEAAHLAMDYDQSSRLLSQIDTACKKQKMPLAGGAKEQVEVVRVWVKEAAARLGHEKGFEDACTALQEGIDTDLPTPELERRYRAALTFLEELPPQLESQYQQRLHDRAQRSRRKMTMVISAIVAIVILSLTGAGFWFYRSSYESTMERWADIACDAKTNLDTTGDIARARSTRKTIDTEAARYVSEPYLAKAIQTLDDAIRNEDARSVSFAAKLQAASQAPLDSPDTKALESAKALAKRQDEQDAVQDLQNRINDYQQKKTGEAETAFESQAKTIRQNIESQLTAKAFTTDKAQFIQTLGKLDSEVSQLGTNTQVSASFRSSLVQSLEVLLDQRRELIGKNEAEAARIESIISTSGVMDTLADNLKEYCDQFPNGSKVLDFQKSLTRIDAERALMAWGNICAGMSQDPRNAKEATDRIEAIEAYLKNYPRSPLAESISAYRDLLKKGLDAIGDDGPILKTIKPVMAGELLTELYVVTTTDGKTEKVYYTAAQPSLHEDSVGKSFRAYLSPNLRRDTKIDIARSAKTSMDNGGTTAAESPQMQISKHVSDRIDHLEYPDWTTLSLFTANEILKSKDLNLVVKGILLQRVLAAHDEMLQWASGDVFKRTGDRLAELSLSDVAWMDPDSPPPSPLTDKITAIMRECPDLGNVQSDIAKKIAQISSVTRFRPTGTGIVVSRLGQSTTIYSLIKPIDGCTAEVLPANGQAPLGDEGPSLSPVAHMQGREWVFDKVLMSDTPEGSVVFLRNSR